MTCVCVCRVLWAHISLGLISNDWNTDDQLTTTSFSLHIYTHAHTETYHMISRCDPDVATWSKSGDSFVIKNVEQCK